MFFIFSIIGFSCFFILRFFFVHTETLNFTPVNLQTKKAGGIALLSKPMRFFFFIFALFGNSLLIYMLEGDSDPASLFFTIIMAF